MSGLLRRQAPGAAGKRRRKLFIAGRKARDCRPPGSGAETVGGVIQGLDHGHGDTAAGVAPGSRAHQNWRSGIDFCMKEGGTVCWVAPQSERCWAVSSSDAAPILCALGASVRLVSARGERELLLADLYREDGIDYLTKQPDEVLTEVVIPAPGELESSFWKLRRRGSIDFPVLSVAAAVLRDSEGRVEEAHVWLGAVASAPVRSDAAAQVLIGEALTPDVVARAAQATRKIATPLDNTDFTLQWRSKMVVVYVDCRSPGSSHLR